MERKLSELLSDLAILEEKYMEIMKTILENHIIILKINILGGKYYDTI